MCIYVYRELRLLMDYHQRYGVDVKAYSSLLDEVGKEGAMDMSPSNGMHNGKATSIAATEWEWPEELKLTLKELSDYVEEKLSKHFLFFDITKLEELKEYLK